MPSAVSVINHVPSLHSNTWAISASGAYSSALPSSSHQNFQPSKPKIVPYKTKIVGDAGRNRAEQLPDANAKSVRCADHINMPGGSRDDYPPPILPPQVFDSSTSRRYIIGAYLGKVRILNKSFFARSRVILFDAFRKG